MALTDHISPTADSAFSAISPAFARRTTAVSDEIVQGFLAGRAIIDYPVADLTTYKVGGRAHFYFVAESIADLEAVSELQRQTGLGVVVIGRGSNVLFADAGYPGLVMQLGAFTSQMDIPHDASDQGSGVRVTVRSGSSVLLPVAARQTASIGLRGFEWAVGVPGTIGGAVRMNAGGHGSDLATSLRSVEIFNLISGELRTLSVQDVGLRFRGSALTDAQIVVNASLELVKGSRPEALAVIEEVVKWRRVHQPGGQNAGSVFVNPVPHEVSAGELIDTCGHRGFRVGTAHVSEKHANFIQSDSEGTASDVVAVMRAVRNAVARQTGYTLRSEVRLLGFPADVVAELSAPENSANETAGGS